jgi:hypothetical protein
LNFGSQSLPGSGNMSVKIERSGTGFCPQNLPFQQVLVWQVLVYPTQARPPMPWQSQGEWQLGANWAYA